MNKSDNIYISHDGTRKDTSTMNYEYLVNALSKALREIFESDSIEGYELTYHNIETLENEIHKRLGEFFKEQADKWH